MVKVGDELEITGLNAAPVKTIATGVEMFKKSMDQGQAGDNVGILLRGLKREDVLRGQVCVCPVGVWSGRPVREPRVPASRVLCFRGCVCARVCCVSAGVCACVWVWVLNA